MYEAAGPNEPDNWFGSLSPGGLAGVGVNSPWYKNACITRCDWADVVFTASPLRMNTAPNNIPQQSVAHR
jgi:hypothetical protein